MKTFVSAISLVLVISSLANASLVDYDCAVSDSGTFQVTGFNIGPQGSDYSLDMDGIQYGQSAHFSGFFKTNSKPITIEISEQIINQTSFAWHGYKIYISMSKEFAIGQAALPVGWTSLVKQPVFVSDENFGGWLGEIDFKGDVPIEYGDFVTLMFNLSFEGKTDFCTTHIANPEPASLLLLGLGSLSLLGCKRLKH